MEDHDIDFRVPGLSHAVVKEAEHADLQQNNVQQFESDDPRIG